MSYVISVIGKKGGTKKSTTCRALAVEFARAGWSVAIADFDSDQSTCFKWATTRNEAGHKPSVDVAKYLNAKQAVDELKQSYEMILMDGGATANVVSYDIAMLSDLIVITSNTSREDIEPAASLALELQQAGIDPNRICIAFAPAFDNANDLRQAKAYFEESDFHVIQEHITPKISYSHALESGLSITETPCQSLRVKALRFADQVSNQLEAITG